MLVLQIMKIFASKQQRGRFVAALVFPHGYGSLRVEQRECHQSESLRRTVRADEHRSSDLPVLFPGDRLHRRSR